MLFKVVKMLSKRCQMLFKGCQFVKWYQCIECSIMGWNWNAKLYVMSCRQLNEIPFRSLESNDWFHENDQIQLII